MIGNTTPHSKPWTQAPGYWFVLIVFSFAGCQSVRIETRDIPQVTASSRTEPISVNGRTDIVSPPTESDSTGTLSYQFENDTFANNSDNNLTAAFGFTWTSATIDTFAQDNWIRNLVEEDLSFLPTVSDPDYEQFWQIALGMEMHTAKDTATPDPPPDQHPYSGIILLDTALYSMSEDTMHAYYLRLGFVGPATGAEGIQNTIHDKTSRSGDREDYFSQFSFGATLLYARFALTYRTTLVNDFSKDPGHDDDFSDITLSYTF